MTAPVVNMWSALAMLPIFFQIIGSLLIILLVAAIYRMIFK